jgi:twinkle protein
VVTLTGDRYARRGTKPERVYVKPKLPEQVKRALRPKGRAFLEGRMIDADLAAQVGVYSNPEDTALAFPYRKHGEEVHCKYREFHPGKRFWTTTDTEPVFYGYDDVGDSDTVVIVEGELEYLSLLTVGIDKVVSLPGGAVQPGASADGKLACMESAAHIFERARRVVIATDSDAPGEATARELIRRIGPEKCWRAVFPDDCNDPNDVLVKHGFEALIEAIEYAHPAPVEGIFTGYDVEDELERLYDSGPERGAAFGYDAFDACYSVLPGYMTVVTGHAGSGKSTVLDQLLVKLAEREDWRFAIFSPEQMPLIWHQQVLIQQHTGYSFFDGPSPRLTKGEMLDANQWVSDHFSFIAPEDSTVERILNLARIEVYRRGINGIVIDPWNELDHTGRGNLTETENVSLVLGKIRQFARNHNVHVWIVAHPTKMPRGADGLEAIPQLDSISGSNNFRNKADFGLTVWRDLQNPDGRVDILVTKSRRRDLALQGTRVEFRFNKANDRLIEVGRVAL